MITCVRTEDQKRKFGVKILNDLKDILSDPKKVFNTKSYIKSIYDTVYEKTKDQNLALNYARLTPSYVYKIHAFNVSDLIDISDKGYDPREVVAAIKLFGDKDKGLQNTVDYLEVQKSEIQQIEEEIKTSEEQLAEKKAEEKYQEANAIPYRQRPISAVTTTINELLDPNDPSKGGNPQMQYYTQFVKDILKNKLSDRVSADELSGIEYDGVEGGLHLALMKYTQIPQSQWYPGFGNTREDKYKLENDFVYVLTDKNGKPVLFDNNYKVSGTGRYIYYDARFLPPKKNGKFDYSKLSNVQTPSEIAKNKGISIEEATEILDNEFAFLEKHYEYLKKNPTAFILNAITGGSFGAVVNLNAEYRPISDIKLDGQSVQVEILTKERAVNHTRNPKSVGGFYMFVSDFSSPFFLKTKVVSSEDLNMVSDLITSDVFNNSGDKLSNETKISFIKQLLNLQKGKIGVYYNKATNSIVLKVKGEAVPTNKVKETLQQLLQAKEEIDKPRYNPAVKLINSGSIYLPSIQEDARTGQKVLSIESMSKMDYLNKIATALVELDNNGKLMQYNPYFSLLPLYNQLDKIMPLEITPVEEIPTALGIPEESAARIDLVSKFGFDQSFIDKLTSPEVVDLYKEQLEKQAEKEEEKLTTEEFNRLGVKEKKQVIVNQLKKGEKITGDIERPDTAKTGFVFKTSGGKKVTFYNPKAPDVSPIDAEDLTKKATLKLVDKVVTPTGKEYLNVVQVFIGDKYVGNLRESTDAEFNEAQKEIIKKADEIVEETKDNTPADNKDVESIIKGNVDLLKRFKNKLDDQTNIQATYEQILEAKKWYESSPLFSKVIDASKVDKSKVKDKKDAVNTGDIFLENGQYREVVIPFRVMFNVINTRTPGSIATWDVQGITLYKGADYSDLYHEAWHGFTQMFMTKEQRAELYGEARKQKGTFKSFLGRIISFQDATIEELEEHLAENFREFMLSGGKKTFEKAPVKNKFFKWLLDILKLLFGKTNVFDNTFNGTNDSLINSLYEKLRVGNLNEYSFNQRNAQFSLLNSKRFIPIVEGIDTPNTLSKEEAQLMLDTVDALFGQLVNDLTKQNKAFIGILKDPEGRSYAYQYVYQELYKKLEEKVNEREELKKEEKSTQEVDNDIALLSYSLTNFGDPNAPGNTHGLVGYHDKNSTFLDFDSTVVDTDPNLYEKNEFERNSGADISMQALIDTSFLWHVKTLFATDANKNIIKNRLGFPKLADFNRSWTRITNITQESKSIDDIYKKLNNARTDYPIIAQLLDKIGSPAESVDDDMGNRQSVSLWTQFAKIATMPRISLVILRMGVEQKRIVITPKRAQGEFSKIGQKWNNEFPLISSPYVTKDPINNATVLNVDQVLKDFRSINDQNVYAFLEAIGMPVEQTGAAKIDFVSRNILEEVKRGAYGALQGIQKYNATGPKEPIVITKPGDIFKDFTPQLPENIDKSLKFQLSGASSRWNAIQEFQLAWSDDYSDTTVSNATNENQYERSLRSTVSQRVDKLNNATTTAELFIDPTTNDLDPSRYPFTATSIYFKRLFNKEGKKNGAAYVELLNMSGLSREIETVEKITEFAGVASSSADPIAKQLQDFYMMMLYGVNEATRHADKSTTYLYRFVSPEGKVHPIPFSQLFDFSVTTGPAIKELVITDIFLGYLASELTRIGKLKSGDPAGNTIVGKEGVLYKDTGSKLVIFDKILKNLNPEFKETLLNQTFQDVASAQTYIANNTNLRDALQTEIKRYLGERIAEQNEFFNSINFFDNSKLVNPIIDKIVPRLKPTASDAEKEAYNKNIKFAKDNITLAYIVNDWLHKYESQILFYGDLALYGKPEEVVDNLFKRNAGVASTGDIPRSDSYMVKWINKKLGENSYAVKRGKTTIKNWGPTMNSAVMQDPITESVYIEDYITKAQTAEENRLKALGKSSAEITNAKTEIEKIFRKAYGEMKEADGQGYISFDSYRALLMSLDKWTPYQEDLYNKIVNEEDVSTKDIIQFFPVKKMQYYGPLQTTGLPVYGFHKYSLLPLIPNMIKDSHLEVLHNKMVDQDIDYTLFLSGSKVNTVTTNGKLDKFYNHSSRKDKDGNFDDTLALSDPTYQFTKNTIFLDYFKDQLEVNDIYKGKNTFSTQLRKLIEEGLMENGVPTDWNTKLTDPEKRYVQWNALTPDQKRAEGSLNYESLLVYEDLLQKLVDLKKEELRQEIQGKDKKQLLEFLQKEMSRRELADHEIEFVSNHPDHLELSFSAENIEKILVAVVEKRLVNVKVNGEALVQVSGVGFEKPGRLRGATKEEINAYGTDGLSFYQSIDGKTKAMKVKISMQGSFKHLLNLPEVIRLSNQSQGRLSRLDALNALIKTDEWLNDGDNRKMITSVAVRIPVQALNSMEFMEVYEFLPESSGNIVVLPAEIVAKSGGDFDIDKMYTLFPNLKTETRLSKDTYVAIEDKLKIKIGRKGVERLQKLQELSETEGVDYLTEEDKEILEIVDKYGYTENKVSLISGDSIKGIENQLLTAMANILSMPENFVKLVTPNTTITLETIAQDMAKKTRGVKTASPTEVFEIPTNLYKQQSNSVGKAVLGIIAVANTFSTLFNRTGLLMELEARISQTKKGEDVNHRQKLLVPHNTIDGKISLSSLYSVDGQKLISDLISQMINGSVDVAKNAWIFDIQGNREAINALLFMTMAGTPPRHAVAFLSQPIIKDYFDEIARLKSITNVPLGTPDPGKFFRTNSRDNIINNPKYGFGFKASEANNQGGIDRLPKGELFKALQNVADLAETDIQNQQILENNISVGPKEEYSDLDRAVFAHFLEIMEMTGKITQITQTLNFDTTKSRTLLNARLKQAKIETLANGIARKTINDLMNNSPIAAFGIGEFLIEMFDKVLPLRDNTAVTEYIQDIIKYVPGKGTLIEKYLDNTSFFDEDSYLERWRSDIVSYMFQNTYYDKAAVKDSYSNMPVQYVVPLSLEKGVGLKDGILYVDLKSVEKLYQESPYKKIFDYYANENLQKQLFLKFLLEKEVQFEINKDRYQEIKKTKQFGEYYNVSTKESVADKLLDAFDKVMADKALDTLNLHKHMFYGEKAFAKQIMNLKDTHPELFKEYDFLNNLELVTTKSGAESIYNLKIKGLPTKLQRDVFHENIIKLMDMGVEKDKDPLENGRISDLFKRLAVFAVLQSGTDTSSSFSLIRYIPNDDYLRVMEEPYKKLLELPESDMKKFLDRYTELFNKQYNIGNPLKKKIKNYVNTQQGVAAFTIPAAYEEFEVEETVEPTTPTVTAVPAVSILTLKEYADKTTARFVNTKEVLRKDDIEYYNDRVADLIEGRLQYAMFALEDLNNKQYLPFINKLKENGFRPVEGLPYIFSKNGINPYQEYERLYKPTTPTVGAEEKFKKDIDQLLKDGLTALEKAGKDKYILGFHGGRKFDKPDRSKQYTGEFRSADARRIAESMGARYEGQMLFFTNEEGDQLYNYENAIKDASFYALKFGDENPTVYAYLIPVEEADFTDRGIGEVALSYDAIEKGKYKEVGRAGFNRFLQTPVTTEGKQDTAVVTSTGPIKNPGDQFILEKFKYTIGKFDQVFRLKLAPGVLTNVVYTPAAVKKLLSYYPDAVFVYNQTQKQTSSRGNNTIFGILGPQNSFGITTKKGTNPETNLMDVITDDPNTGKIRDEVKEAIDAQIQELVAIRDSGRMIVFDANGYGQYMVGFKESNPEEKIDLAKRGNKLDAPDTFRYLSEQLLRNFGFINNPEYIGSSKAKAVLKELGNITDEAVREFKLNCLRSKKS